MMTDDEFRSSWQSCVAAFSISAPVHEKVANLFIAARRMHITNSYIRAIGQAPNYINPITYAEKMQCRKLFDRNPLFPVFCDKLLARDYVRNAVSDLMFPEIYWCGDDPEKIPFDCLPVAYMIKPNHRSGSTYVLRDTNRDTRSQVRAFCRKWLETSYGQGLGEWGYRDVQRRIYAEELLPAPAGLLYPVDYKLVTFHGRVESIQHTFGRDVNFHVTIFDRNWKRKKVRIWYGWKDGKDRASRCLQDVPRPKKLDRMLEIAEQLGRNIDHIRVDLFEVGGDIFFGEITVYEGSGFNFPFPEDVEPVCLPPHGLDYQFDANWRLPPMTMSEKLRRAAFS